MDGPSKKREKLTTELAQCEFCYIIDEKENFTKSRRFCSMSCAKKYSVSFGKNSDMESSQKIKRHHDKEHRNEGDDWKNCGKTSPDKKATFHCAAEIVSTPLTPQNNKIEVSSPTIAKARSLPKSPRKWTIDDVCEFIKALPGCANCAYKFRVQEIDGLAMLLLNEDVLMTAMKMKLGPTLKICDRIRLLKDEIKNQY